MSELAKNMLASLQCPLTEESARKQVAAHKLTKAAELLKMAGYIEEAEVVRGLLKTKITKQASTYEETLFEVGQED